MAEPKTKPKQRKKLSSDYGAPPSRKETLKNTTHPGTAELKPLQFRVDEEFLYDYKQFALNHRTKMVDVLKRSFRLAQENPELFQDTSS